jgi:hypothetical protein
VQKLHLVGITPELDGLILSTRKGAKSGSFVVTVDASVLEQLNAGATKGRGGRTNGTRPSREPRQTSPESQLAPREMQELLRQGWTIDEVADEAGVDADWVGRFASPVLAEMKRVLDAALALVFEKPRVGPSAMALAPSVRRNVAERGLRLTDEDFDEMWRTYQLDDELWIVAFEYVSRGREQVAEWVVDLDAGELSSHNRLGTQLGYAQTGRRRAATSQPAKATKPKKKATAKKATPAARPRSRQAAATKPTAAAAKKKKAPKPDAPDVYREELRRRLADPVTAAAARPPVVRAMPTSVLPTPAPRRATRPDPAPPVRVEREPDPRPAPPPPAPPRRAPELVNKPVPIIGPTVRALHRRPSRRSAPPQPPVEPVTGPTPAVQDDLPDLSWSPPSTRGPMPAPEPLPVPKQVREKVATPIGTAEADDLPAETWFPKGPTIKGAKQGAAPSAPKRRRSEPLRGR